MSEISSFCDDKSKTIYSIIRIVKKLERIEFSINCITIHLAAYSKKNIEEKTCLLKQPSKYISFIHQGQNENIKIIYKKNKYFLDDFH